MVIPTAVSPLPHSLTHTHIHLHLVKQFVVKQFYIFKRYYLHSNISLMVDELINSGDCDAAAMFPYNIYRLLNVYCVIFSASSYGEGRTSLRVRLRHMNDCRIFLLYTCCINVLVSSGQST